MKTHPAFLRSLLLAACVGLSCHANAKDFAIIKGDFDNMGSDTGGHGSASAIFTPNNPKFFLEFRSLVPATEYQFAVDGVVKETFTTNSRGGFRADFRTHASAGKRLLDFDPRGKILSILDAEGEVLSMVFSGEGEPDDIRVDERTSLEPAATETTGRVELRYLEQKNKDRFIVHFNSLERGSYELYVDGELQAGIDLNRGHSTMRSFELGKNAQAAKKPAHGHGPGHGHSKKLELDFDPRGRIVDVVRDGEIVFTGKMLAKIPGLDVVNAGEATATLDTTGADPDASGSAILTLAPSGELALTVEVSALPAGDYDLVVGGTVRGTITVTGVEPDSTGEMVFSSDPEAGELLLNFDPLGHTFEVKQGTTIYLEGTMPNTLTETTPPDTTETELPLLNIGAEAGASAHATLTADSADALVRLEVELEDVAVGNYDFKVGGVVRGVLIVADVDGVLSGELLFGGTGLPLTFDPRGQTVTIEQGATVLFTRPL